MTDTQIGRAEWASFSQLVQELISGSVRRHTFTQSELELLFDLQNSRVRKSSRADLLRRYLRAAHQHLSKEATLLRLSTFLERQAVPRGNAAATAATVRDQIASLPQAG